MMHRVLITGAGGGIGRSLRETLRGVYPVLRAVRPGAARAGASGNDGIEEVDQTDIADMAQVETHGRRLSTASSISAASRARTAGRRSSKATSSASTTCSRRRAGPGSSASSWRPRTTPSASTRAARRSTTGSCRARTAATASRRRSRKRSPASTPTSTASAFCAPGSAISGRSRSTAGALSIWISPRDYTQLVRIGLEHPDIHFEIVYGVSNNQRSWYDNSNAYRLGYRPQDDSEPYAAEILAAEAGQPKDPIAERYQGGTFCADRIRRRGSSRHRICSSPARGCLERAREKRRVSP